MYLYLNNQKNIIKYNIKTKTYSYLVTYKYYVFKFKMSNNVQL